MTIEELKQKNCDMLIPTKWNIYQWCEAHPKTSIACAMRRVEKIFDLSDAIHLGFSSGKDSTITANLACLELNLRRLRLQEGVMRDGTPGVDPLDAKWDGQRLNMAQTNAEVVWSASNEYTKRFVARMGPQGTYTLGVSDQFTPTGISSDGLKQLRKELAANDLVRIKGIRSAQQARFVYQNVTKISGDEGAPVIRVLETGEEVPLSAKNVQHHGGFDLITHNEVCIPMSWQSGVSFNSGVLISWNPQEKDMWVQEMPKAENFHGFEPLNAENLRTANPVPVAALGEAAAKWHEENGNTFETTLKSLFGGADLWSGLLTHDGRGIDDLGMKVPAVGNFGRGPTLSDIKAGTHEKEEQDSYSEWFAQTSWLVMNRHYFEEDGFMNECKRRIGELYDLSKDVWHMKPAEQDGRKSGTSHAPLWADGIVSTALISLRAEESLDRRVILSQGEYSTGQYSNNRGMNVCSPVFDMTTQDVWRLFAATDWDVNDIYEKMYEAGIGIGDQRVGSLLNYAAVRQIHTVKALEPELYGRINQRFSNVEFMSQFSRSGYFRISKPRDSHWDGKNHIKAGVSPEEVKRLSDRYESMLQQLNIPYRRDGDEFWTEDPKFKGKPWFPFKNALEQFLQ